MLAIRRHRCHCLRRSSRWRAQAEVQVVRIGETFGLTHLPSYIVEDLHLIEKHAAKRGSTA